MSIEDLQAQYRAAWYKFMDKYNETKDPVACRAEHEAWLEIKIQIDKLKRGGVKY